MKDITIIVPVFNEEEAIPLFFEAVEPVMKATALPYTYLFIDDGSTDNTPAVIDNFTKKLGNVRRITFSRNFGKEAALLCGLQHTKTAAAITIDADLQNPPSLIPAFIEKWQQGFKMVYGIRADRSKRVFAKAFYKVYNLFTPRPIPHNASDFRLLDRDVIAAVTLAAGGERVLFMKGLFNWVGFKSAGIEYICPKRSAGATKWSQWKLWNFALDGIFNSTTVPLRVWSYVGGCVAGLAVLYSLFIVLKVLFLGKDVPGYASLIVSILFLGGVQLISIGILGEYIGRIFRETKKLPLYIIAGNTLENEDK